MNYLSIILGVVSATIVRLGILMVWYSPWLFGNWWLALTKISPESTAKMEWGLIAETIAAVITALIMTCFMYRLHIHTVTSGFHFGWMCWLAFVVPLLMQSIVWEKHSLFLALINGGFHFFALITTGAILGLFL